MRKFTIFRSRDVSASCSKTGLRTISRTFVFERWIIDSRSLPPPHSEMFFLADLSSMCPYLIQRCLSGRWSFVVSEDDVEKSNRLTSICWPTRDSKIHGWSLVPQLDLDVDELAMWRGVFALSWTTQERPSSTTITTPLNEKVYDCIYIIAEIVKS